MLHILQQRWLSLLGDAVAGAKVNERRCRQAAQLFADLARARKGALATAHAGNCPFAQHMLAQAVQLNEVSCCISW